MEDIVYMKAALEAAYRAAGRGEAPIGAVVVRKSDGKIVGVGENTREACRSATGHAEISAIEDACSRLGGWRVSGFDLFVTLEPCPMCAGAVINARIDRVVFGAYDEKNGSFGSVTDLSKLPYNHKPQVVGGIMREECERILKKFFFDIRSRRKMNDLKFIPVKTEEQINTAAKLADEIWHECFKGIISDGQIDYMVDMFQSAKAMTKQIQNDGYRYFFIHRNGVHMGYTAVHEEENGILFLSKIYIKKEYRGNGYAAKTMEFLKELCREEGLTGIRLTVNKHNDNAIGVYKKLGFELTGEGTADIGGGYVMDDYYFKLNVTER